MSQKAQLKNNFYIMYLDGQFVLTNTETHESFALEKETFLKLADEDAVKNEDFIEAKIVETVGAENQAKWPFSPVSRFFHQTTKILEKEVMSATNRQFWEAYLGICERTLDRAEIIKPPECLKVIELPKAREAAGSLHAALKNRRTIREFFEESISLQELADILFTAFGKFHDGFGEKYIDVPENISWRRSSPGAGGLHSISAYVVIERVPELEQGVYFYDAREHQLRFLKTGSFENEFTENLMGQRFHIGAAINIFTVSDLRVVGFKYSHSRAMLIPYLENGHLMQTALLTATNMGLQGWITAALCDEYFGKLLNLQSYQALLSMVSLGHGDNSALGPKIRDELDKIKHDRMMVGAMSISAIKEKAVQKEKDREKEQEQKK